MKSVVVRSIVFVAISISTSLSFAMDNSPQTVHVAPWQFILQLATVTTPKGCFFSTPGVDGSNIDWSKPIPLRLTNASGKYDQMEIPPDADIISTYDATTKIVTTSATINGKLVVTKGGSAPQMIFAKLGTVNCGQD